MRIWASLALALLAGAAGCSRSGLPVVPGSASAQASHAAEHATTALVATLRIAIPSELLRASRAGLRHQAFVAKTTKSAEVHAFVHGTRTHPVAVVVADLASGEPACATSASGRSCSIAVRVPKAGSYDFTMRTFDQIPQDAKIPPSAKPLGFGVVTATMSKSTTLGVTLGGIVASTLTSLPVSSGPAIVPFARTATVEALDADGNAIVSDAYVDALGNPVTIAMSAGTAGANLFSFAPASFAQPVAGVTVTDQPAHLNSTQAVDGAAVTIEAAPSNGVAAHGAPLMLTPPHLTEQPDPWPTGHPFSLVTGADSALWFAQYQSSEMGRVTTSWAFSEFPTTSAAQAPTSVAAGPDKALWFTAQASNAIGRMTTAGSVSAWNIPTTPGSPAQIALGPDGALWFTEFEGNKIGRITTAGVITAEYPIPSAHSEPQGIATGPDGALWFTECSTAKIGRITTAGAISEYQLAAGTRAGQIITGPDGALWFTTCGAAIGRITTSGSATLYTLPGEPNGIAVGPDAALWFGVLRPSGVDSVGRLVPGTLFTDYAIPGNNPFPSAVVKGPDDAVWFTDLNDGTIGRFQ